MARLIGPDEASREVKALVGGIFRGKAGRPVQLWTDEAATVPADVQLLDGTPVTDSTVTVDASSMLPLLQFPDGDVDTIYGTCDGGPAWPIYARTDDRIEALTPGGAVADLAYDAQGRVTGYTEPAAEWSDITYDAAGRVASYKVNGTARTVSYNASGRIAGVG